MKKCTKRGDASWSRATIGFNGKSGVEIHVIGSWPKNTPYINVTDSHGDVLGSVSGRRDLKTLRRAIEKALGIK